MYSRTVSRSEFGNGESFPSIRVYADGVSAECMWGEPVDSVDGVGLSGEGSGVTEVLKQAWDGQWVIEDGSALGPGMGGSGTRVTAFTTELGSERGAAVADCRSNSWILKWLMGIRFKTRLLDAAALAGGSATVEVRSKAWKIRFRISGFLWTSSAISKESEYSACFDQCGWFLLND